VKKRIISIPQDRLSKDYVGRTIDEIAEDINDTKLRLDKADEEVNILIDECNRLQKKNQLKDYLIMGLSGFLIGSLIALLSTI